MDVDVPYMASVKNMHKILDAIQNAGAPEAFGVDFLKDLGFSSSNDRSIIKVLKYLGFLDGSGKPQASYRDFMDHMKSRVILAGRLREAYDDVFLSGKDAHTRTAEKLTGWFKTKTGSSEAVAKKMATTFKTLAKYADFSKAVPSTKKPEPPRPEKKEDASKPRPSFDAGLGLTYRIEIHLPDTTNVDTYRSIFRALREELLS